MIEEERKIAESSPEAADAVTREQTAETTTVKAAEKTAGNTADILSGNTIGNAAGIPSGNTIKNAAGNTVEDIADKPKSRKRDILETVLYLAVVVGICLLFIRFVAYRCVVEGSSMEHYLEDKDNLIAERITYYFRKPERFEVIIFKREGESRHGQEKGDSLIKRIIGLPGETVSISNGKVSINGKVLEEDHYAMAGYTSAMEPVTLGEDEYFVLGDNRDISLDSRYIGPVKFSAFEGRAWIRIWPMNKIMVIRPDN